MMRRALTLVLLVSLLASLAGAVQAQPQTARLDLVAVPISSSEELTRMQETGLALYARLPGTLLTAADAAGQRALAAKGLGYEILDVDAAALLDGTSTEQLYLVYPAPGHTLEWDSYGRSILPVGGARLLLLSSAQAEGLSRAGAELQRVSLAPRPLTIPAAPDWPDVVNPDPLIQLMMDQVNSATVSTYDRQMAGEEPVWVDGGWYTIPSRETYSGVPIQKTTHWVGQHMADLGLNVDYHTWGGNTYPNVIGELPGLINPNDIFIICAHVDDVSGTPGADDNGSGSVAVMIAADIMTQYQWGCTLRFALWTGEEQGLNGSAAYAQRAYQRGENIVGVLNLDMIAWNTLGSRPDIDLHADQSIPPTMALAQLYSDVVDAYNINLNPQIVPDGIGASDHASFWNYGYTAILGIEDYMSDDDGEDFNPYYHGPGDTTAHTDLGYFTNFVKASIGTFAHMSGCLIPNGIGYLDGHVTAATGGAPIDGATVVAVADSGYGYPATTDPTGYYTRTLLSGSYTVTASAYGYLPTTVTGVDILTESVTTQDFALPSAPTHVVSGTVTEAGTGAPLWAEIAFEGTPVTVWSDPGTGFYQATLAEGVYTMSVRANLHRPQARAVTVDHDQTQNFVLEPLPCLLLVDDDQDDPDVRTYYTLALDSLGLDYDVWDTSVDGDPNADTLTSYRQVIWYTGYPYANTFNSDNEAAATALLDAGGNLLLSSQDYLYEFNLTSFGQNYLHIGDYSSDVDQTVVTGANLYAGLGPYGLSYPFTNYSDIVEPDGQSVVAFTGNAGNAAVAYDGSFHTVFLGFPLEAIATTADRAHVLDATMNFFSGCECSPVYDATMERTPITPTVGQPVAFTGAASGTLPIAFAWSFGDGGMGSGPTPSHVYNQPGVYTVVMTATNCATATFAVNRTITVEPEQCDPVHGADFSWFPPAPIVGQEVTLSGIANGTAPFTYTWDLGDGTLTTGTPVAHTYATAGDYAVIMTVTNACGEQVVGYTLTVLPVCEPVSGAAFAWTPPVPLAGEVVTMTAAASGTAPISFTWDLGDGSPLLAGATITHSYTAGGAYVVSLLATNACGQEVVTHTLPITEVVPPPCVPVQQLAFFWTPLTPTVGQPITGTAGATGTLPITFSWSFGDGETGSGPSVTHSFATAGSYSVTVTATNGCGVQTLVQSLIVAPEPQVWTVYLPIVVKNN